MVARPRYAGGDAAAGTHAIRDSLELADGTGMRMLQPLHRRLLSDALRRWLDAAVETADRQGAVVPGTGRNAPADRLRAVTPAQGSEFGVAGLQER
jgi:hypothetical protein